MFAALRLHLVPILMSLVSAGSLPACHRDRASKEAEIQSTAEVKRSAESARQALEGLKPPLDALNSKFAALQKQFDALAPDLPGFGETRGKFYATAEGLGRLNAKLPWLSGRIEAAVKSKNRAELQEISNDIAGTHDQFAQIDRIGLELVHRVLPFKQLQEARNASGNSCE